MAFTIFTTLCYLSTLLSVQIFDQECQNHRFELCPPAILFADNVVSRVSSAISPTLSPYHLTETGPVWSLSSRGGERGSVQFTMEWHCLLSDNVSGVSWAGPDWQRWLEMNTGHFGGPSPGPWVDLWIPQLTLRGTGTPSGGYYQDNGCLFFQLAGWT